MRLDQRKFLESSRAFKHKGVVWSLETVRQAFQIRYICGVQGYEFIRNIGYPLPSYRTLCDRVQHSSFLPGIQNDVLQWLQCKLQPMALQEKDCVLMLDEMAVRRCFEYDKGIRCFVGQVSMDVLNSANCKEVTLASNALVFMIRGLTTNWKQVIAYYMTSKSVDGSVLWQLIRNIIVELGKCSVNVRAVVCDMGSCNRAMWKVAGVGASRDGIHNYVQHPFFADQSLFFMADVPHVLKNVRNCMLTQDILLPADVVQQCQLPGPIVSIGHVRKLVALQEKSDLKIAPFVRRQHVEPKQFEKMKVRFAAQLMSHSTASALRFAVGQNLLPKAALTTAWFLELMNSWFDVTNSRSRLQGLHASSSAKLCILHQMLQLAPKLSFSGRVNSTCTWKPIQTGILMATKSVIDLHASLVLTGLYRFLLTSRLTQDSLENLFSQIRGRGDSHPSPVQFRHNLRLISVAQFVKTPKHTSYAVDESQFVVPFLKSKMDERVRNTEVQPPSEVCGEVSVGNVTDNVCEANALYYLTGWVAFKLKAELQSCAACVAWIVHSSDVSEIYDKADIQLTLQKSFADLGNDHGLTIPSEPLKNLLLSAERVFNDSKLECLYHADVQQTLLNRSKLFLHDLTIPQCHNLAQRVLTKFFRLRLHIWCKRRSETVEDDCQHGSKSAKSRCTVK
jgi:hypothetical protein